MMSNHGGSPVGNSKLWCSRQAAVTCCIQRIATQMDTLKAGATGSRKSPLEIE